MGITSFASRTAATRDDWQTPLEIVQALGQFDLDPCANCHSPTRLASQGYTITDNGLIRSWNGRVWLNPPYGADTKHWLLRLSTHGNGIALIPPRMGSKWFHECVLDTCNGVFFLKGRVAFLDTATGRAVKGNNADSVLVAYGDENVHSIAASGLLGKLWVMPQRDYDI
jgi:phage N-6-adenine-methyltransferase